MKAWPIDPLVFRNLKLEVSEKLETTRFVVAAFESERPKRSASRYQLDRPVGESWWHGDTVKLRGSSYRQAYQVGPERAPMAGPAAPGTVRIALDWVIRSQVLNGPPGHTDAAQRLDGGGLPRASSSSGRAWGLRYSPAPRRRGPSEQRPEPRPRAEGAPTRSRGRAAAPGRGQTVPQG